jgi:hypothetical protein
MSEPCDVSTGGAWRTPRIFFQPPLRRASGGQIADSRRGKCHAQKFPFSRSLPGVLMVTWPDDFGDVDG